MENSCSKSYLSVVNQRHFKRLICLLILTLLVVINPSVSMALRSSQSSIGPYVEYTLFMSNGTLVSGNVPSATPSTNANSQPSDIVAHNEKLPTVATTTVSVGGVPNGIAFDPLNGELYAGKLFARNGFGHQRDR